MPERRLYEAVKYTFTRDEIRELGEALARESQAVMDLHDRKVATAAALAAQIKEGQTRMGDLTTKINNGYELREVECVAEMDSPRPGMKRIVRLDDPDIEIRIEAMTMQEMQSSFGFSEGSDPRPEK